MSERNRALQDFIQQAGWGTAAQSPIKGDASTRSYMRLKQGDRVAVLMNAPAGAEAPGEPEGATIEDRQKLGYNAVARLAGPNLEAFLCVGQELKIRGFSAPDIIAADIAQGFALLEDFGAKDVWSLLSERPDMELAIYEGAIDTLAAIYRSSFATRTSFDGAQWRIRDYDDAARLVEVDLLLDYFAPDVGRIVSEADRKDYHDLWREAFKRLSVHAPGLCLRDFHAQNLFWLPDRDDEAKIGLIDFQDALFSHPAYDLVSLLEDARRDVNPALVDPLMARFCDKAGLDDDDAFRSAYAVTGAQRNAKIIGIFVRLAVRDGKPDYRTLIPRVREHFKNDLSHPACANLRDWFSKHLPEVLA